jgi:glycosyltransferase involved in cell wall biosynthesis
MTKSLYICYFGFREPLVQTQVLPYLREIRKSGAEITLLTFEPNQRASWTAEEIDEQKKILAASGIEWHQLPYHKRPSLPATAYDVLNGFRYVLKLHRKRKFDILHARVHIPALIAVLVKKLSRHKPKILFDIRGFVPEEYADAGVWKQGGFLFRLAKRAEAWVMRDSDGFVILTEAARDVLFPESARDGFDKHGRPVEVIPCCVDLEKRFSGDYDALRDETRRDLGVEGRRVIIHVGSLVGLYLTPQIIEFLKVAREKDPSVFALFLTQSDPQDIIARLREAGFGENDFLVTRVKQEDVPSYLCASDVGLSFVQSSYATISRSPTKIPEYLACRLPVIANAGVGDVDRLIESHGIGAIVREFDPAHYARAIEELKGLEGVGDRAVQTVENEFDLVSVGGERYRRLYRRLSRDEKRTLYICYFGITEPLVQTQVLPYLRELRAGSKGHDDERLRVHPTILTFEPFPPPDSESIRASLAAEGIVWHCLPYHKRWSTIATGWDIIRGTDFIRRLIARRRPDVLHGRVHIATLMGALARRVSRHKPKLLFDIRGFFPEEYTDAGVWPEGGWLFRTAKRVEKWLMAESDGFVVLTEKARDILFPESRDGGRDKFGRPVEVIPCCVDLKKFTSPDPATRRRVRERIGAGDRPVVVYVGSFGGWYLSDDMVEFFNAVREHDPSTFVLVLTQRDKANVESRLINAGFDRQDFFVDSVPPDEIPNYLEASDIAVSFIKSCYSKQSSSPTKLAEYLAAGLPVIANAGVGDVDSIIVDNKVGLILHGLGNECYRQALRVFDFSSDGIKEKCRRVAESEFDLETIGGVRYQSIYRRLLEGGDESK